MEKKELSREEKILSICEAVKAQSDTQVAQDNLLLGGLCMAYDSGYMDDRRRARERSRLKKRWHL